MLAAVAGGSRPCVSPTSNIRLDDVRATGVTFEDRQDLLGQKSGRMTTHYSQAELSKLIEAAEKVCEAESRNSSATTWLRRKSGWI